MDKYFVPDDLALKLRDKGFNEFCLAGYLIADECQFAIFGIDVDHDVLDANIDSWLMAPMWLQVVDWLRKKHGVIVQVTYEGTTPGGKNKFIGDIFKDGIVEEDDTIYRNYYGAWYDVINEALNEI